MQNREDQPHLNRPTRWNQEWYLHCSGVIRRQPSPPPFPEAFVVYEFTSLPEDHEDPAGPVIVWFAVPEDVVVPFYVLRHLGTDRLSSFASAWPRLRVLSAEAKVAFYDLEAQPQPVRWQDCYGEIG